MSCGLKARRGTDWRGPLLGGLAAAAAALAWLAWDAGGDIAWPAAAVLAAAAALLLASRLAGGRRRAAQHAAMLEAALDADYQARLLIGRGGVELYRNRAAAEIFGSPDPLAEIEKRAAGDERALEEITRLRSAAATGMRYRAEVALTLPGGEREWLMLAVQPTADGAVMWSGEDESARRALEETVRREHEMLADFVDFLPVGCYCADIEGRLRFVNHRLAEWLGRSNAEMLGQNLRDLLGTVPDPEQERAELRMVGRNGDVFQALVSHSVFDEGGETFTRSVVFRDHMPERQWERALKMAERRFRWLFDDAPVGIALVDPDNSISACNTAFGQLIGLPAEEAAGRSIADIIAPEHRADAMAQMAKVMMAASPEAHLEVGLSGRRELVVSLYVSPAIEDGNISGLVLHFIDATERKNLEIQFAQSQKMQAMGQLAGGIAHDFNNLLTAMIGFCDLLLQRHGPGDPSFADVMQIKQNANRAASLVRQLLAFSRRQALQPRLLNVTDALADLSNLLRRLLGETIELRMVHGRGLGLVRVDPGQFDQVIINLAVNARDAMPGGGTLTIRTAAAKIDRPVQRGAELMPAGDYVMIEVADTGTGISEDTIGRIFEPFFSTKEVGAGTGLGLSTVYGILRQTDGFVFVDSAPGHGATFTIYLPRNDSEAVAAKPRSEPQPVGDLTGTGTILLVEDEDAVRLFGSRALRNKGYKVIEARSGEGALDVLRGDDHIDVLISDVVMPGMDGVTLARLVRMERPQIRVILISGYSEDVARGSLSDTEGIHFLPKPFSLKQLAGAVKEVFPHENG